MLLIVLLLVSKNLFIYTHIFDIIKNGRDESTERENTEDKQEHKPATKASRPGKGLRRKPKTDWSHTQESGF